MATGSNTGETVRVIVRCRPMNQREIDLKCQTVISMSTQINQVSLINVEQSSEPPKQFTFDAVYAEESITENIYADSVFPLVESVLEGYNATVFAYGQTGCGKSFTMQGVNVPGSPQRGIIPRSFEHIFEASSVTAGTKYLIRASYLEIYNETIRDLLSKDVKATLDLKEYVDKGVQVPNLTWHQCTNVLDCERLMDRGNKNRATGATLMNKDSSRSHSIFTILTEMCTRSELDGKEHIRAGKLNLVDLAGSERQSKTHAEGERLREATRINLSLSALGNVISALVDSRSKHIPYRDSKLTRLLQDSLGGNTKTLMVAAISPAHDNYEETLSTLRYANRAKNIKNKPRINEDPRDAQMKLLQEEINRLKQELLSAGNQPRSNQFPSSTTGGGTVSQYEYDEEIEREKERLRIEFERETSELRRQCQTERLTKEELQRKYEELQGQYQSEVDALTPTKSKKKSSTAKKDLSTMNSEEKLQLLHELENKFIGGEEINNEERKKKRKKKLIDMREKQEQRKKFSRILEANDEDMMMNVFDNVQEELNFTTKKFEHLSVENKRLKSDNDDLQHEFELEREGYLSTIRMQEKTLLLHRTLLDKMSSLMQRNCNYSNINKIIEQVRYDEEKNEYIIPDPFIEEIQLPQVGKSSSGQTARLTQNDYQSSSRTFHSPPTKTDYEYHSTIPLQTNSTSQRHITQMNSDEIERRYGQTLDLSNIPTGKIRNKRQEQLLNENASLQNNKLRSLQVNNNSSENDYMNRRLNPYDASVRLSQKYGFSTDKP